MHVVRFTIIRAHLWFFFSKVKERLWLHNVILWHAARHGKELQTKTFIGWNIKSHDIDIKTRKHPTSPDLHVISIHHLT